MIRRQHTAGQLGNINGRICSRDKLISQPTAHASVLVDHASTPLSRTLHRETVETPLIRLNVTVPQTSNDVPPEIEFEPNGHLVTPNASVEKPRRLRGVTREIQIEEDPELRPLCLISDNRYYF